VPEVLDSCVDIMGITKYCADRDSYVNVQWDTQQTRRMMVCTKNYHQDSPLEEVEHLVRGISQGLSDAFVAATPFMGPAIEFASCASGILYSCAVFLVDVGEELGKELAPEQYQQYVAGVAAANDGIEIARQVKSCWNGDVGACARVGSRGANLAGLKIPGKDAAKTVDDANKCKSGDNDACTRIGQSVVDVSGLNVKN
jgi:hypothetical protein